MQMFFISTAKNREENRPLPCTAAHKKKRFGKTEPLTEH